MQNESEALTRLVSDEHNGKRFDQALAAEFPQYSRARLQRWIRDGTATVNGEHRRPRDAVAAGEVLRLSSGRVASPGDGHQRDGEVMAAPEAIALDVVHEDDALIVINKPAGLVVHPGAGHPTGTLVNALLHHDPSLAGVPRAGVVHRLDKDTTGLLVVARTLTSHTKLVRMLARRDIVREYFGLVHGRVTAGSTVDAPIGRSPSVRTKMAVVASGRAAVTHYRLNERFRAHTALTIRLESGRTHQIRVHMAHIGHAMVGDPVYGGRPRPLARASETLAQRLRTFRRQALHAMHLQLKHPLHERVCGWEAPIPPDLDELLSALRVDRDDASRHARR